jgi:hypothetical protein
MTLRQWCAATLIALAVLPFTAPFKTCSVRARRSPFGTSQSATQAGAVLPTYNEAPALLAPLNTRSLRDAQLSPAAGAVPSVSAAAAWRECRASASLSNSPPDLVRPLTLRI